MNRQWLGALIIIFWLSQAYYLFPLPSQMAATIATGTPAISAATAEDYEHTLWLGWWFRLAVVPIGVASGILALRDLNKWAGAFLVGAIIYIAVARPWEWLPSYGSWMLLHPGIIYAAFIFPLFLVAVGAYAAQQITTRYRRHAR